MKRGEVLGGWEVEQEFEHPDFEFRLALPKKDSVMSRTQISDEKRAKGTK